MKSLAPTVLVLLLAATSRAGDLEKALSPDTDVVLAVDVGRILATPAMKSYAPRIVSKLGHLALREMLMDAFEKQQFQANLTVVKNFLDDREEVLKLLSYLGDTVDRYVIVGSIRAQKPELVAIEGQWRRDHAEAQFTLASLLLPHHSTTLKERGRKLFDVHPEGAPSAFVSFPADGLIVVSDSKDAIHDIYDRLDGKLPGARPAVRAFLRNPGAESVVHFFLDSRQMGAKLTGGIKLSADLEAEIVVVASGKDEASGIEKDIATWLTDARESLAKAGHMDHAARIVAKAVRSIAIERDGLTIKCRATLLSRELDALVKALEKSLD
jgi:hypothetical protein